MDAVAGPDGRSAGVSLGPTSWSAVQGAFPRRRLLIHLGRDPSALTLMLRQDQAQAPRRLKLFARAAGQSWIPIDDEPGTTARRPIEGLERVAGDPQCAGWHVAVVAHAARWSVAVEDLQSPLGVYVEVPEHINDDR